MKNRVINCDLNKLKKFVYKIEFKVIVTSQASPTGTSALQSEETDLTNFIKTFQIYKMFDDFYFPVIKVDLTLDPKTHEAIIDDLKAVKFVFTLKRFLWDDFNSDNDEYDETKCQFETIYNNVELYVNDYDKNAYSGSEDFQIPWESENEGFQSPKYLPITLELFPKQNLFTPRHIVKGIYRNITRNELLVKMVKEYEKLNSNSKSDLKNKTFLVNQSVNEGIIPQVIFPNLNYLQTFNYLQSVYGFYSTGIRIFFDFKRNYVLYGDFNEPYITKKEVSTESKSGYKGVIITRNSNEIIKHAGENGRGIAPESKNIFIIAGKAAVEFSGSYYDGGSFFIYGPNTYMINFNDVSNKEIYGEHIKIKRTNILYKDEFENGTTYNQYKEFREKSYLVNDSDVLNKWINTEWQVVNNTKIINDYDFYKNKRSGNQINKSYNLENQPKYEYWYNPYSTNVQETELDNFIRKNSIIYDLQFKNIDIDLCTPNKKYLLKFINETYNQNYDGAYQLRSSLDEFVPFKPGLYNSTTSLSLYKLDDDHMTSGEKDALNNMNVITDQNNISL